MPTILSYITLADGEPTRASLGVLTRCRELARAHGHALAAVIAAPDAESGAEVVQRYGAATVYAVSDDAFEQALNPHLVDALAAVIERAQPVLVAFPSTERVKDILGALAVRTGGVAVSDVAAFDLADAGLDTLRPVMTAKLLARTRAEAPEGAPVLVSVRNGSYAAEEAPVEGAVEAVPFEAGKVRQTLREVIASVSDGVDLSDARIVVSAGRGVKDEAGKQLVEELAAVTGAAIGASRGNIETGMFPEEALVGQTGKVVSPDIYFAIGMSGALQHLAGMSGSRVIVAVNKDPDAPIFDVATYGLVGDLYEVLPALIAEIKKTQSANEMASAG
ncbi:MAG: electron transfer flavoprotein subunit alpha/FixB family protein [Bacteroidota bacterium]